MSTEASSSSSQPSVTVPTSTSNSSSNARQVAEARAAIQASMHNIGSRLDADLQSRASTLHSNAAALSKQEAQLATATKALGKETDKLKRVAEDAQRKIKELGNVQNWAEVLEREFLVLEETVRLVDEGCDTDSGSGSGSVSEDDWEPCRVCRKDGLEDDILLCDGYREGIGGRRCDAPYHMQCIGLVERPVGDWFCPDCKKSQASLRRTVSSGMQMPTTTGAADGDGDGDVEMGGMHEMSLDTTQQLAMMQRDDGTWS